VLPVSPFYFFSQVASAYATNQSQQSFIRQSVAILRERKPKWRTLYIALMMALIVLGKLLKDLRGGPLLKCATLCTVNLIIHSIP
jgi:hypothetical protein